MTSGFGHSTRRGGDLPPDPQRAPWDAAGPRAHYREQLRGLDEAFVLLGEQVIRWSAALSVRSAAPGPSLEALEQLTALATRLEDRAFSTIAREAPVAGDLRATVVVIRSIHDVLRAGRLVHHIAGALLDIRDDLADLAERADRVERMLEVAVEVFAGGIRAWRERDALAVAELQRRDETVDRLRDELLADLPTGVPADVTVAYVFLCRYLERLGDHGVNLARQAAWSVTGDRVSSHPRLDGTDD